MSLRRASLKNDSKTGSELDTSNGIPTIDRSATYVVESINDKVNNLGNSKFSGEYTIPRIDSAKIQASNSKIVPPKIKSPANPGFSNSKTTIIKKTNNNDNENETRDKESNRSSKNVSKSTSLATLKQQKKAELLKSSNTKNNTVDGLPKEDNIVSNSSKSMDLILKHAKKSGQLNLSDFELLESI